MSVGVSTYQTIVGLDSSVNAGWVWRSLGFCRATRPVGASTASSGAVGSQDISVDASRHEVAIYAFSAPSGQSA